MSPYYTVYDGEHAWADFDESEDVLARYLFGDRIDEIVARWTPGNGTAWYLTDHLGTVRDIVDDAGDLLNTITYDSFGNIVVQTNAAAGDRFTYTGREYDSELDLYYYRARFYDPQIGRFVSQDPIGFAGGDANLYRYVGNAPTIWVDPLGNVATTAAGGFAAWAGAGSAAVAFATPGLVAGSAYSGYKIGEGINNVGLNPLTPVFVGAVDGYYGVTEWINSWFDGGSRPFTRPRRGPSNAPPGTRTVDQVLNHDQVENLKRQLRHDGTGVAPDSWVGISPDGDVIVTNSDGTAENLGPLDGYLPELAPPPDGDNPSSPNSGPSPAFLPPPGGGPSAPKNS